MSRTTAYHLNAPVRAFVLACLAALFTGLVLFFCGCSTTGTRTEYTPTELRADIDAAVGTAAALRLAGHPERRPAWESAERGLRALSDAQRWEVNAFVDAFAVSGLDHVQNERVRLAIENGLAAVVVVARERVNLSDPNWARAVIEGAQSGIARALRLSL